MDLIFAEVPSSEVTRAALSDGGVAVVDLLVGSGLATSKADARRKIQGGGIYLNNLREASVSRAVTAGDLLFGKHLLLRKGKRNYVVVTAA